ncbi:MAG: hypothetical protein CR986_07550 [Ignavibacteriae bacterium]|nr:MAG: hypothetical protein CR986_07550 [Ignavibacteriota bacterium]
MNKENLTESIQQELTFRKNSAKYNSIKKHVNKFLVKVNKNHFLHRLDEAVKISKETIFTVKEVRK